MVRIALILSMIYCSFALKAQSGFTLEIVPYGIGELPPIHAYAFAQYDGKWLILGGRTGQAEESSYLNYELMVINPETEEFWQYPLEFASTALEDPEHLGNCYAAHFQDGRYLYIAGGMGFTTKSEAFGPFPVLTIVDVPKTIESIVKNQALKDCFFQIEKEAFGRQDALLTKINNRFYLVGGRQVTGSYDDKGELDVQSKYANFVYSFLLVRDQEGWEIVGEKTMDNEEDFTNAMASYAPQIFPDGEEGLTMFLNGPKKINERLKWMNIFNFGYSIYSNGDATIAPFHSTIIPIFDAESNKMHTIFIGGCDDYYCSNEPGYIPGKIDNYDAFVRNRKGITSTSSVTIDAFMAKGRDAQFLLSEDVGQYPNKVIDLQQIGMEGELIGYIYGGATAPGMMMYKDGTSKDKAVNQLFKVYLKKTDQSELLGWQMMDNTDPMLRINIPLE